MARAEPVYDSEVERRVAEAGNGMVLFVTQSIWETLIIQGESEGCGPGAILNKAVKAYLEERGCQEAVDYLFALSGEGQPVASGDGR